MRLAPFTEEAGQQQIVGRTIPAWLTSLAFHLAVLLAVGLLLRTWPVSRTLDEPSQGTSIVLLQSSDTHPPQFFVADELAHSAMTKVAAGSDFAGAADSQ